MVFLRSKELIFSQFYSELPIFWMKQRDIKLVIQPNNPKYIRVINVWFSLDPLNIK